jgi:MoaA/NifB/PqqE/SkfB family radical SAM enzyme
MFDFNTIDEYQIEITTHCNAACPQCPRNDNGQGINPHMPLTYLPREVIDRAFSQQLVTRLRQVFFCGSYGDPIAHPDFLDILRDFRAKSPTVWLYIHTNAGIRNPDWWAELADILHGYGKIDFGIDGLSDTNHLYRRNVSWNKVMANVQSFINAGGKAQWNYIVFKHNEHQVDEAQSLSKQLGFETFLPRNTGRFFHHARVEELNSWPAPGYDLEPPVDEKYRNRSMLRLTELKTQYTNIRDYFDSTEIKCDALLGRKVVITAEGLVLPCNFFTHNLYDARFHDSNVLPGRSELSLVNGKNQISEIINTYGFDNLSIKHQTLADIFANGFWQHVTDSWTRSLDQGRIFECAMTCGSKLTKVWDQTK